MANNIALVDDDKNILTSVAIALEAEGFQVRTYSDGAEAMRGLAQHPADLAILDIKMPRMDGMELLGQLRKQSAMPVIFLTSKDDEVDEVLGLRMGADAIFCGKLRHLMRIKEWTTAFHSLAAMPPHRQASIGARKSRER